MELIKYRDAGMSTYTWFWTDKEKHVVSPYFDSEIDALEWMDKIWNTWKPNRDCTY